MNINEFVARTGRMIKENNTVINIADLLSGFVNSRNGAIDVNIQDQDTDVVDLMVSSKIQDITLTAVAAVDSSSITFDAGQAPVAGNLICLKEGFNFYQGYIITGGVTDNGGGNYTVELDSPLDREFSVAGGCSERSTNMAVDGSTTPVIFSVSPKNLDSSLKWDITRIIGSMIDEAAMDDGKFGGVTALSKGVLFRKKNNEYKNLFNVKKNGDLALRTFDASYVPATQGPSGNYGFRFRRTYAGQNKTGVVVRLQASTNDELQVIIQDDLTALVEFTMVAQGHVVD